MRTRHRRTRPKRLPPIGPSHRKPLSAILALALLLMSVGLVVAACGVSGTIGDAGTVSTSSTETTESTGTTETTLPPETSTTAPAETTTTLGSQGTMTISVYFTRDEKITPVHRVIPQTKEVGAAAIKALLAGPTAAEKAFGLGTNIPDGTTFLGLSIKNGVATLDLSKEYASGGGSLSMFARLAEVVYTLTQFPSVKGVQLKLDGKPVEVFGGEGLVLDHPLTRADFEDLTPAILVESPCIGDKIKSPVRIYGSANVFEGVFQVNLVNWDGLIIAKSRVQATSGTGQRGTFDVTLPFSVDQSGRGALIVFSESPKDGSHINVVEIPLELVK